MTASRFFTRLREERGQAIPLLIVSVVVLLGCAGLTIDVGHAWLQKRRLQSSVDLALLAAAQKLPDTITATSDASTYTLKNWTKVTSDPVSTAVTTSCQVSGCAQPDKISLTATSQVSNFFLTVFGVNSFTIKATGAACGPCDSSVNKFDVVVVLDRSYSMCLDSNNNYNNCLDMDNAVAGIKALIPFFNTSTDRLSLVLLGSSDDKSPFDHSGSAAPCDTANVADASVSGKGMYYKSIGDFMDGTPGNHDSWVVAPLANDFKLANGSLNNSSGIVSTLNCVQHKYWTPIAPAIDQARQTLVNNWRADASKVIVYMGDGGANAQPMKRDANGNPLATQSWYTPTPGNNLLPCHDAVAQAQKAKDLGIIIYTIGYDLNASSANQCAKNNSTTVETGIDARTALQQMATPGPGHFYEKATPGEVYTIFSAIGHLITTGGTRLIQ